MDSSNKVKDLNDTVIADTSDEDAPGSDFRKAVAYVYIGKDLTGARSSIDTLTNCNKVEHDKIWVYNEKLSQERRNIENSSKFWKLKSES